MIKPTIGRVVLVNSGNFSQTQWLAATITYVHSEQLINVAGFEPGGRPFTETSITLLQGPVTEDPVYIPKELLGQRFACWMPYQRQQAEKAQDQR